MLPRYLTDDELMLLHSLAEGNQSVYDLEHATALSKTSIQQIISDFEKMGWITKVADNKVSLNRSLRTIDAFRAYTQLSYNFPPHIKSLRNFITGALGGITDESVILLIRVIGSYGTNDFVNGVSDIDLVLVHQDELPISATEDLLTSFSGDINGTSIEVWDISRMRFDQLALEGRFFALWVLNVGLHLFGDYSPPTVGELRFSNIVADIQRDFIDALVNKLAKVKEQQQSLNILVNLSKRASVVFNAYINGEFSRDGLVSARALGLEPEYLRILDAKRDLRSELHKTFREFSEIISPFHQSLYSKYLSDEQRRSLQGYIKAQVHDLVQKKIAAVESEALVHAGLNMFDSFLQ